MQLTKTLIFFRHKYNAIALPSFDVAPDKKTSFTSLGISLRITAAVKVLPCTTRTLRSGCLLTKRVPPPLRDSFCAHTTHKRLQRNYMHWHNIDHVRFYLPKFITSSQTIVCKSNHIVSSYWLWVYFL